MAAATVGQVKRVGSLIWYPTSASIYFEDKNRWVIGKRHELS